MAQITNEIPSGTIDSVNTVFTTANPIAMIVDIIIDGVEYFDYTVVYGSNTITLDDAPTASIRVDYYDTASYVTATGMSAGDLRIDFNRILKDTSGVSADLFNLWLNAISNYIYRVISNQEPERFIVDETYTVTTNTDDYALPSGFWSINRKDTGIFKLDTNDNLEGEMIKTGFKDSREGYYINGNTIKVTPESRSNEFSMVLRYIPRISQISGTSDEIPLPDEFKEVILHALKKMYYEYDRNAGEEQMSDQRFARMLDDLMSEYSRVSDNFDYIDTSLSY